VTNGTPELVLEGFGLRNIRTRASQIDGKLDIHTAASHGTSIVLTVPTPL
jgi:signal transduction histidine kinase